MNRITKRFEVLKNRQEPAFIPYITAGDPSIEQTEQIIYALESAGADVIELGVPFSDPVGDGPVIQAAAARALEKHVNLKQIFAMVQRVRERSEVPLLLFSYFNPIFVYGYDRFASEAAASGVDGVLCVDFPPEEATEYKEALQRNGIATVFLTAPTTTDDRLELVAKQCTGFVYYVSRLGVTGEQAALAADLDDALARIKRHTDKPVAVGFGISTPEQAAKVAGLAEGVVVGSAIVRLIAEAGDSPDTASRVLEFAKSLADAAKGRAVAAG
ncbi:MAG: tryptophan synthase subunit alpha [Candidatus Hydrogenedentes bacterium]|nr:tryptophan synthase subunit alpha [Candidatus Hydrogenedentota bacterium]